MTGIETTTLDDFTAGTTTEPIARTLKLNLETSERKNERVRSVIDDWQSVARVMADYLPTFPPWRWSGRDTQLTRVAQKEAPADISLYAHDRNAAAYKVQEAFNSWHERGREGANPRGEYGDGDYMRLCSCCTKPAKRVEIVENNRGYGMKLKMVPRTDPVWFHIRTGEYQEQYLKRLVSGEASYGAVELRLSDDQLYAHLSLEEEVEVFESSDVSTRVGVDLGESSLYAVAVVSGDGSVNQVEIESGSEFRHHRERLERRRKELSQKGDLQGVKAVRGERRRYTEHITHRASKKIVTVARDHSPAVIRLEDLTHYRETAEDPIHDWPFRMLQEQIAYKATQVGLPVEFVDPSETSITCRHCGQTTPEARNGDEFHCRRCGYEVHADVNAAINIAAVEDT